MPTKNIIILYGAIALVLLFGLFIASSYTTGSSRSSPDENDSEATISGSLVYPSERIPQEVVVCAKNMQSFEKVCTDSYESSRFVYGIGYELGLEHGTYTVFASLGNNKAYYNEYVREYIGSNAWLDYDVNLCSEYLPLEINTRDLSAQGDVAVGDWYYSAQCPNLELTERSETP